MKASSSIALIALLGVANTPAFAFDLNAAAQAVSPVSGGQTSEQNAQLLGLTQALSTLSVTPLQMLGGTGALLGLAQSQLQGSDYAQLAASVPGIEGLTGNQALNQLGALGGVGAVGSSLGGNLGGLLGKSVQAQTGQSAELAQIGTLLNGVQNMQDVNQAFSALGMDASMSGQFAPILLQFLGNQGVAAPLMQNLSGIWGVGSTVVPGGATGTVPASTVGAGSGNGS